MIRRSRQFSLSPREERFDWGHRCKLMLTVCQEPKKSRDKRGRLGGLLPSRLLPTAYCLLPSVMVPPQGFEPRTNRIMRGVEGHQPGQTKRDKPVFTESAAVKVPYILLSLST